MFLFRFINRKKHLDLSFFNIDEFSFQVVIFLFNIVMINIKDFNDDNNDNETTFVSNFVNSFVMT